MTLKIYTTTTCPFCKKTKEWLSENNVEYEEINVSGNQEAAKEMIDKSGQMGVPVLDIDGTIIVGFDKDAIENALLGKGGSESDSSEESEGSDESDSDDGE